MKANMPLLLLSSFLFLTHNIAKADPRDFISQRQNVIRELEANSILPKKIINDLASLKIFVRNDFIKDPKASRKSAFADYNNKQIILNGNADFSGDLTTLILHESLSAAGWLDVNYEYSVLITQLLKDANKPFLTAQMREIYTNQLKNIAKGELVDYKINDGKLIDLANSTLASKDGDAVIVGGGGDLKCAQIKEEILRKFNNELAYNPGFQKRRYKTVVFGLKIETANNPANNNRVRAKSSFKAKAGYQEYIFFVPSSVSQEQATKDIWQFVIFYGNLLSRTNTGDTYGTFDYYIPRGAIERSNFSRNPENYRVKNTR